MKTLVQILLLGAVVACAGSSSGDMAEPKAAREDVAMGEVRARVVAVDQQTRMVTLQTATGEKLTFRADEAVRNLPQVKVGDEVVGQLVEALAIEVREPTPEELANPAAVAEELARAEPGEKPGGRYVRVMREVFRIEGIDKGAGTVTVASYADGVRSTIKARDPRNLDKIDVGDTAVLTYTESLTIAVVTPGQ
jgi:hypothetical protein